MENDIKLKLIEYWIDDFDNFGDIPNDLKTQISNEEIVKFLLEVEPSQDSVGGTNSIKISDLYNHGEKIRREIKENLEISSIKSDSETKKKQTEIMNEQKEIQKEQTTISKGMSQSQKHMNKLQTFLLWLTLILALATVWQAYETHQLGVISLQQITPKINIDLYSQKMPYIFDTQLSYRANYIQFDKSNNIKNPDGTLTNDFSTHINVTIYNLGENSVKLENIYYTSSCGDSHKNTLYISSNKDRLISPSEKLELDLVAFIHFSSIKNDTNTCELKLDFNFDSLTMTKTVGIKLK